MPLSNGTRLGGYEILSALGAGGMGEVYRARDTRLDRDVAIKILPQAFVADAERVARFQREAKVLASLNHPHIAAIYGLEEANGVTALVMELVEGEDLSQRLTRGRISLDEALPIANQIATALEAAHGQGIIHRDLKPANIKVRPDGTVKVLDFGLAKAVARDTEVPDLADSPTVTAVATRAGTILGTVSYMSPEQAKGRAVDKRADIWAFGAVLYELLTGTRAFHGESVAEILSHVLTQAPNWALLPADTPLPIRTLLRRCLEKNPTRRLDSAVTLRLEIDDALAAPAGVTTDDPQARRRGVTWKVMAAAVVFAGLITSIGTWAVTRPAPPAPAIQTRFTITPPPTDPLSLFSWGRDIALSPDGRYLAYGSAGRVMLRALDQLDVVKLSSAWGTPFFSPDSRWIGFFDGSDLKKVAVTGQPVITLCRNLGESQGGTWGDDDTIVVSNTDGNIGLRKCSADGRETTAMVLTKTDAANEGHMTPSMLPGGRGVLFWISANSSEDRQIAVLDLKSGQQKTLFRGGFAAEYLDTGHLLYLTSRSPDQTFATLWMVAFDLDRLELRGESVRVSETLRVDMGGGANYAVSKSGALAYVPARAEVRSFVWVDRAGRETPVVADALPPRPYNTLGLSSDGKRLAFDSFDREFDIWTWDFERESLTQVTSGPALDHLPRWTPDSRRIVFRSSQGGLPNLYSVAADGSGPVERLTTTSSDQYPNSITPDRTLLFADGRVKTGFDILRRPLAAPQGAGNGALSDDRLSEELLATSAHEFAANISPNGRYFAYQSGQSDGRFVIQVRPYPDASTTRWQVSSGFGVAPVWADRELFYLDESNNLMAVSVDTSGPKFSHGKPARVWGDKKYWGNFYSYDVTRDGLRFLMMKNSSADDQSRTSVVVVLNWFEELKRLLPSR